MFGSAHLGLLLLRGTLGYAAFVCFVQAAVDLPLANLALLSRFHPLLGGLASHLIWGERFDSGDLLRLVVALAGVCLVALPDPHAPVVASALAMGAALLTAGAFLCVRGLARHGEPQLHAIAAFHVASVVYPLANLSVWVVPTAAEIAWLLGAAVSMHGAQVAMTHLLSTQGSLYAGGASFLVSIWSLLLGLTFAGDAMPSANVVLGAALVIGPVVTQPPLPPLVHEVPVGLAPHGNLQAELCADLRDPKKTA